MTYDWLVYACLFLALWNGVIGGVFSAFSEFIMRGLLRAAPAGGIEAMQQINRTVLRTQFVAGILLVPFLSAGLGAYAVMTLDGTARTALVLAPLVFIPTVFLMTLFGNVPMNNRLDRLDPAAPDAEAYWRTYGRDWTRLNHFRTVGCVVTACAYLVAAVSLAAPDAAF